MMTKIRLMSIIVPMYNERETIIDVLLALKKLRIKGCKKEVIVVDDGSNDGGDILANLFIAEEKLENFKFVRCGENLGKGQAVRIGIEASNGDLVIIQDADLEYHPTEIPKLLKPFLKSKTTQVVYGSRFLRKYKPVYPLYYFGNILLAKLTNFIYGSKITDMETGYKVLSREALNSILPLKAKGFDIEPEITAKLLKGGFKIKEVSILYKSRTKKEGKKITLKDGIKAIFYLLKYQFVD